MSLEIREISIKDVEAFTTLMQQVFEESKYMLYDPGEYVPSLEYAISNLEEVITSPHLAILVAEKNDMLVGSDTLPLSLNASIALNIRQESLWVF